jgi:hypothetical protein
MHEGKLDPRLRFLREHSAADRAEFAESARLGPVATVRRVASVEVLLRCRKAPGTKTPRSVEKKLTDWGMTVHSLVDGPAIVVSFTPGPEEWQTVEDNQGQHFAVTVP